jgi:hypothetical protein
MSHIDPEGIAEAVEEADALSEPTSAKQIGQSRLRKEDARLVTGATTWTDNIQMPGLLHMAVLRSPMAHARVRSSTCPGPRRAPASSPCSPAPTSRRTWRRCPALAGDRRHGAPRPLAAGPRRGPPRR